MTHLGLVFQASRCCCEDGCSNFREASGPTVSREHENPSDLRMYISDFFSHWSARLEGDAALHQTAGRRVSLRDGRAPARRSREPSWATGVPGRMDGPVRPLVRLSAHLCVVSSEHAVLVAILEPGTSSESAPRIPRRLETLGESDGGHRSASDMLAGCFCDSSRGFPVRVLVFFTKKYCVTTRPEQGGAAQQQADAR